MAKKNNKKAEKKKIEQPVDMNVSEEKMIDDLKNLTLMENTEVEEVLETKTVEITEDKLKDAILKVVEKTAEQLKEENKEVAVEEVDPYKMAEDIAKEFGVMDGDKVELQISEDEEGEDTFVEDYSCIDVNAIAEQLEEMEVEEGDTPKEEKKTEKPKKERMTYEQMFGGAWTISY